MGIKFAYHNCIKKELAQVVLVGVPDESGSHALWRGASRGPNSIRKASLERLTFFHRSGKQHVVPERGTFSASLFDVGDILKTELINFIENLRACQFPVVLGGDHSITYNTVKGLGKHHKNLALVYFDAHPDLVSSETHYYGSVVSDIYELPHVCKKKIIEVGIRSIEPEEIRNIRAKKITSFTSLDINEKGVPAVFSKIKKKLGKTPVYLSIDLDVIDPTFAPGVETLAPFGLTSNEYLSLIKKCASQLNLIGFDLMEMSPKQDFQQKTAQLAAQSIIELIGSKKF